MVVLVVSISIGAYRMSLRLKFRTMVSTGFGLLSIAMVRIHAARSQELDIKQRHAKNIPEVAYCIALQCHNMEAQ